MQATRPFNTIEHQTDLCVVGGGMAGWATAIRAARCGARVVLMHDRPVLGGNASSECRVHICGADRHNGIPHKRETGLTEELRMLNLHRNPNQSFSVFDTLLYEMIINEPNITLLLNTSCQNAIMNGTSIQSVTGWELAAETYHTVNAKWFADCSGDGILAPLSGASFRIGREAKSEFNESLAPETADDKTMGHSIRYQVKRYDTPQTFIPPAWANVYESCEELPAGHNGNLEGLGWWWIELGGEHDTIGQTAYLRDELLKIAYGVWDHIKNRCHKRRDDTKYLNLEWMQFLPAKRESRRYVGNYVLNQNDLADGGQFNDTVAYGGWTMDDHDFAGFLAAKNKRPATHFHQCPSPYGIPFRCLFGNDVDNLLFGGRNISATHMAMSSTRVMATGMVMGEAVGTAIGLMIEKQLDRPIQVMDHIDTLQQRLMAQDCYLPNVKIALPPLTANAKLTASTGDPEPVRDGVGRQIDDDPHAWLAGPEDWIAYEFDTPQHVNQVDIAFDSAMHLDPQMSWSNHCRGRHLTQLPETLAQRYRIKIKIHDTWQPLIEITDNIHRFRTHRIDRTVQGVKLKLIRYHGNVDQARLYHWIVRS